MATYSISDGQTVNINKDNWPDVVEGIDIENGILNISNDTDEIKLLKFNDIDIKIDSFGSMNVSGQLVKVLDGNGELGQSISLPIPGHSIGIIFVKNPDTKLIEIWRCVNAGSMDYDFSSFPTNSEGGFVYKIEDDAIKFTDTTDGGVVLYDGAEVYIPNIVFSTGDGDSESSHASFESGLGGKLTLKNICFSNFSMSFSDFNYLNLTNVSILKGTSIRYINTGVINLVGISGDSNYSAGASLSYLNNLNIDKLIAQTVKSSGISISYVNSIKMSNSTGVLISRDSSTDAAIYLNTVQDFKLSGCRVIGGMLYTKNCSNGEIDGTNCSNTINLTHSSSYSQPNIKIDSSSALKITNSIIPNGGSSYDSFINILNSSKIDTIGLNADDNYANYLIRCDVAYDCKFVDIYAKDVRSSDVVRMDNKSSKLLLQNARTENKKTYTIYSKDTQVKGIYADDVNIGNGATNTTLFQLFNDDNKGNIFINMIQNNNVKVLSGVPKFDYTSGVLLKKDCVLVYQSDYVLRGVTFDDVDPVVNSSNNKIRVLFAVKTAETTTDYALLTKENLTAINSVIDGKSFSLLLKIDAQDLDDGETGILYNIKLGTNDNRFKYPVYFKEISIMFDDLTVSDPNATFALMYKNNYDKGIGAILTDKDGNPITGKVNGNSILKFEYDYEYNSESARTPNKPFDVVLVATGESVTEPVVIFSEVNDVNVAAFTVNSRPDKAYAIVQELLDNQ